MKINAKTIAGAMGLKLIITAIIILSSLNSTEAQNAKLAHVNTAELMQQLLVKDSVEIKLAQLQKEMQMDLQKKQQELNKDVQEYLVQKDSLSKIMVKMREESLREQQQQLEILPQQYDQAFQAQQLELMQPIRVKLQLAILAISDVEGYTYVFDATGLLYSKGGIDITEKVRTELGLVKPGGTIIK
ncbi:MAG: outer membrane protein [Saprospiraceae bacterium]|jgi:outer membrane protein